MKTLKIGACGAAQLKVEEKELAVNVGSGSLEVFSTPSMIMLMEKAACNCMAEYLEGDETTVGTELNVKHISATPAGRTVKAKAEIIEINGREITFNVSACDESGEIGSGIHKRFLVYSEKFMQKALSKQDVR